MSMAAPQVAFRHEAWRGRLDLAAGVAPAWVLGVLDQEGARRSRHASTRVAEHAGRRVFVKHYAAPAGRRARRAHRMARALERAGFAAPATLLVARHGGEGLLATWDVGGAPLAERLAALRASDAGPRRRKRLLLRRLGTEIARLHGPVSYTVIWCPRTCMRTAPGCAFWITTARGAAACWCGGAASAISCNSGAS
jgi:hypothetical protein